MGQAQLHVVAVMAGRAGEAVPAPGHQFVVGLGQETEQLQGQPQVVHHRRPTEERSSAQRHRDASGQRIVLPLAGRQHELAGKTLGQLERVALARTLIAEARPRGSLAAHDLPGPVRQPRIVPPRRRPVARRSLSRGRDMGRSSHERTA